MSFKKFFLSETLLQHLEEKGHMHPTPIQEKAIPYILLRKDLVASSQTGTGKTLAFCIPVLQRLISSRGRNIRALILTPTRELAVQIGETIRFYSRHLHLSSAVIFGGVNQSNQVRDIRNGADILIATPGRLFDLITQGVLHLKDLEILVIDEADRMLNLGFMDDLKELVQLIPSQRQTIMFSATFPEDVQLLAKAFLSNPVEISTHAESDNPVIEQLLYNVERDRKRALLKHIIKEEKLDQVLIFVRTQNGVDKITRDLNQNGIIAEAIHGDKSQQARQRALQNFKDRTTKVLVATDLAARGLDIPQLPCVINYEVPQSADVYTHRIGRTGRAGAAGKALTFCSDEERKNLKAVQSANSNQWKVMDHQFK